jgi:transposase InsO family protein
MTTKAILDAWELLGFPSAEKLHSYLKNEGTNIPLKDVQSFVRAQPVRQVFAQNPWTKKKTGHITARELNDRWFADLIEQTSNPSREGHNYILIVQDVFSRRIFAKALRTKQPREVVSALRDIVAREEAPNSIETDQGAEFMAKATQRFTEDEGIRLAHKLPSQRNVHATLDRAIASLRQILSRLEVEKKLDWADALEGAVSIYNRTPHDSLGNAAPNDVEKSEALQYAMKRENAQKAEENRQKDEDNANRLETRGNFRVAVDNFRQRGFKQRFGALREVEAAGGGRVVDKEGRSYPIRNTLAVEASGPDVDVPRRLKGGKDIPEHFRVALEEFLIEPKTAKTISNFLRTLGGKGRLKPDALRAFGLTPVRNPDGTMPNPTRWQFS